MEKLCFLLAACKDYSVENGNWNPVDYGRAQAEAKIVCNNGLSTYYSSATCYNGTFWPRRAICGKYPSAEDNEAVKYQGQWFKVFPNPSRRWDIAAEVCAAHGGIPATAISKHLMLKLQHIGSLKHSGHRSTNTVSNDKCKFQIPDGTRWNPQIVFGLKQKWGQKRPNVGWQWIDHGNGKKIDIDTDNSVKPLWTGGQPVSGDNENYGTIYNHHGRKDFYGVNDAPIRHGVYRFVLCQIGYPYYEFIPVHFEDRMTFPHESTTTNVSYDECSESCAKSAFCRAFSYSEVLKECHHHSIPPSDPEAVIASNTNYNIYA